MSVQTCEYCFVFFWRGQGIGQPIPFHIVAKAGGVVVVCCWQKCDLRDGCHPSSGVCMLHPNLACWTAKIEDYV